MEDITPAHHVRLLDLRLNGAQFHDQGEVVTCGPACAGDYVQNRGFDVSGAQDVGRASHMAHIPHLSGEDGHYATVIRDSVPNTKKLMKQGARCAHCGGAVGR